MPEFKTNFDASGKEALALFFKTLSFAVNQMKNCEGIKKLEEALAKLVISERFTLSKMPEELPAENEDMYDYLGVPATLRGFIYSSSLRAAWNTHRSLWSEGKHGKMTLVEVHAYYG